MITKPAVHSYNRNKTPWQLPPNYNTLLTVVTVSDENWRPDPQCCMLSVSEPAHWIPHTIGWLLTTQGWLLEIEIAVEWLNWHAGNTNLGFPVSHTNITWSGLIREELRAIISRALTWELIELELSSASQPQLSAKRQYYLQLRTHVRPSTFYKHKLCTQWRM
jgi:hypothetical protein